MRTKLVRGKTSNLCTERGNLSTTVSEAVLTARTRIQ